MVPNLYHLILENINIDTDLDLFLFLAYILYVCGGLGITAGAHRLWAHRSYKAELPMRILLAIFNSLAFQVLLLSLRVDRSTMRTFYINISDII